MTGASLHAMLLWNRPAKFTPYILAGAGYLDFDPETGEQNQDVALQLGPGFLLDLGSPRWTLRTELLARAADD